jgi:hypothetical protein
MNNQLVLVLSIAVIVLDQTSPQRPFDPVIPAIEYDYEYDYEYEYEAAALPYSYSASR